jgi:hypothetical protein
MASANKVSLQVYSDGSGAPAVYECSGFRFQFDMLGEVKVNLLNAGSAYVSRKALKIAREACVTAYCTELSHQSAEWFHANAAMYAE